MKRIIFVAGCGLTIAACSTNFSDYLPSLSGPPAVTTAELRLESEPPGAEARTLQGQTCRTPCSLTVPAREGLSVTFTLPGYLPQTIPVYVRQPGDPRIDPNAVAATTLTPNPVFAQLEVTPPPAKKGPAKRPVTAAKKKPKAKTTTAPPPAAAPAPPPSGPPPVMPGAVPTAPPPASPWPATPR